MRQEHEKNLWRQPLLSKKRYAFVTQRILSISLVRVFFDMF